MNNSPLPDKPLRQIFDEMNARLSERGFTKYMKTCLRAFEPPPKRIYSRDFRKSAWLFFLTTFDLPGGRLSDTATPHYVMEDLAESLAESSPFKLKEVLQKFIESNICREMPEEKLLKDGITLFSDMLENSILLLSRPSHLYSPEGKTTANSSRPKLPEKIFAGYCIDTFYHPALSPWYFARLLSHLTVPLPCCESVYKYLRSAGLCSTDLSNLPLKTAYISHQSDTEEIDHHETFAEHLSGYLNYCDALYDHLGDKGREFDFISDVFFKFSNTEPGDMRLLHPFRMADTEQAEESLLKMIAKSSADNWNVSQEELLNIIGGKDFTNLPHHVRKDFTDHFENNFRSGFTGLDPEVIGYDNAARWKAFHVLYSKYLETGANRENDIPEYSAQPLQSLKNPANIPIAAAGINSTELLNSSYKCYKVLKPLLGGITREEIVVLVLDSHFRLLNHFRVSIGTVNFSRVEPINIFRPAIFLNACNIVMAHNHPSGGIEPSESDRKITKEIQQLGNQLNIILVDHIIVGTGTFFSFADNHYL